MIFIEPEPEQSRVKQLEGHQVAVGEKIGCMLRSGKKVNILRLDTSIWSDGGYDLWFSTRASHQCPLLPDDTRHLLSPANPLPFSNDGPPNPADIPPHMPTVKCVKFSNYIFLIDHSILDIVFLCDGETYKNKMITIIKPFQAFVETKPFFLICRM